MNLITLLTECYLTEGYPEAQRDFSLTASPEDVATAIATYKDLVNRNQVQGNERNIDYWRKQGWEQFSEFTTAKSQQKSKTQEKRSKTPGNSIILEETPEWLIVIPLNKDASCYHGKNTDWCTAKPNHDHFMSYFHDMNVTLIYFLQINTGKRWAIADIPDEQRVDAFDQLDTKISQDQFKQQTGLDPKKYLEMANSQQNSSTVTTTRQHRKDTLDYIESHRPFDTPSKELEQVLLSVGDGEIIAEYIVGTKTRWAAGERIVVNNPTAALYVAENLLHERWPAAEPAILKDLNILADYVINVCHDGFPEGERAILTNPDNPDLIVRYAGQLPPGRRLKAAEQALLTLIDTKQSAYALYHAVWTMNDRWPEAERRIEAQIDNPAMVIAVLGQPDYLNLLPKWDIKLHPSSFAHNVAVVIDRDGINYTRLPSRQAMDYMKDDVAHTIRDLYPISETDTAIEFFYEDLPAFYHSNPEKLEVEAKIQKFKSDLLRIGAVQICRIWTGAKNVLFAVGTKSL